MYLGATMQEAEDAVQTTMSELLRRWEAIGNRFGYARRAVISNYLKEKTRGLKRIRDHQIELGDVTPEVDDGRAMTAWEDEQWVLQILESLPPAQREVMAFVVDEFKPIEIAELLGKTPEAIRRNLHATRQRLRRTLQQEWMTDKPSQKPN
jgi:RNA polymerase sigma-70 factor (ECF subfamily)